MRAEWRIKGIYKADAQKSLMKSEIKKLHHKKFLKRLEMKHPNFTSVLNGMIAWQQNDTDCNRLEMY